MTGPSAIGSENGTPSSIKSAPAVSSASMMRGVAAGSGSPHVTYAITPQRCSSRSLLNKRLTRFKRSHLRDVFVAPPTQIDDHDFLGRDRVAEPHQPPQR